jgi:hypothetical protein
MHETLNAIILHLNEDGIAARPDTYNPQTTLRITISKATPTLPGGWFINYEDLTLHLNDQEITLHKPDSGIIGGGWGPDSEDTQLYKTTLAHPKALENLTKAIRTYSASKNPTPKQLS